MNFNCSWMCHALTFTDCWMPIQLLSHGKKVRQKSSWVKIKTIYQLLMSRAASTSEKKNNLICCSLKERRWWEKKTKLINTLSPDPLFPSLNFIPSSSPLQPPPVMSSTRRIGNWGCKQFKSLCLCYSFLLILLPWVGFLPQYTVLHKLLHCGSFP